MLNKSFVARIVAKPGQEEQVASFLTGALPLAQAEPTTLVWYVLRVSPSVFYIVDAFADESGRRRHIEGPIAPPEMVKQSMDQNGVPDWLGNLVIELFTDIITPGHVAKPDPGEYEALVGEKPTDFLTWVKDHADTLPQFNSQS